MVELKMLAYKHVTRATCNHFDINYMRPYYIKIHINLAFRTLC